MKRTLYAASFLAWCTDASAQPSVTLFGVLDTGAGRISAIGTGHASGILTGGNATSRLGFRGT